MRRIIRKTIKTTGEVTVTDGATYSSWFSLDEYSEGVLFLNVSAKDAGASSLEITVEVGQDNVTAFPLQDPSGNAIGFPLITATGQYTFQLSNFPMHTRFKYLVLGAAGADGFTFTLDGTFKS